MFSTSSRSCRTQIWRPWLPAGEGPLRELLHGPSSRLHFRTSAVSTSASCYSATATNEGYYNSRPKAVQRIELKEPLEAGDYRQVLTCADVLFVNARSRFAPGAAALHLIPESMDAEV